jgi:HSP20 family molecular chaperone IbpA
MQNLRNIGESVGTTVMERVGRAMGRAQERTPLAVDLLESDDAYLAVFDAPGATSTDVQVQYVDGAVEVRIDRFRGFHEGFEMRYPGRGLSLDGRVELPEDAHVDAEAATATLQDNGTLSVEVPKRDEPAAADDAAETDDADESEAGSSEGSGAGGSEGSGADKTDR